MTPKRKTNDTNIRHLGISFHDKAVIVMEPVKGGTLANLPKDAEKVFESLKGGSNCGKCEKSL